MRLGEESDEGIRGRSEEGRVLKVWRRDLQSKDCVVEMRCGDGECRGNIVILWEG